VKCISASMQEFNLEKDFKNAEQKEESCNHKVLN
jgi:hypothetical protein